MNIEWLQSFVDAAKQKSFSKAALLNNISQPALSKHIQNLEDAFGKKLFHRNPTGIRLTAAGEYAYHRVIPLLEEFSSIKDGLNKLDRTAPIVIGSLPSIATYYLPSKMQDFNYQDKPIRFMLQNTSSELLESLKEGRLDVAFLESREKEGSIMSYDIFSEPYYALLPLNHKYRFEEHINMVDLYDEPLILHTNPCDVRHHIIQQIRLAGYTPNIVAEVDFSDFIYSSVVAGNGITIVPKLLARNLCHLKIHAVPILDFGRERTISLASKNQELALALYQSFKNTNKRNDKRG